jgi:uncharacterized protein YndB with AHSA1/START domain
MDDRVERSIAITAGVERVWDLVTRPGWWINDGEVADAGSGPPGEASRAGPGAHRIERDGDLCRVHDPTCGEFEILVVKLEPRTYAAFRWRSDGVTRSVDGPTTLVEFWLDDHGDGTVTVRVVESGFDGLDSAEDVRRANRDGNDKGWRQELGALARALA